MTGHPSYSRMGEVLERRLSEVLGDFPADVQCAALINLLFRKIQLSKSLTYDQVIIPFARVCEMQRRHDKYARDEAKAKAAKRDNGKAA